MKEPLVLMPGTVTVSLTAVGYQPKDVEIKIEAGSESERKITLDPVPVVIKQVVKDEPEPEPVKPKPPSKLPLYIGAGVTRCARRHRDDHRHHRGRPARHVHRSDVDRERAPRRAVER